MPIQPPFNVPGLHEINGSPVEVIDFTSTGSTVVTPTRQFDVPWARRYQAVDKFIRNIEYDPFTDYDTGTPGSPAPVTTNAEGIAGRTYTN